MIQSARDEIRTDIHNVRDAARTEIRNTVRQIVRGDQGGGGSNAPAVVVVQGRDASAPVLRTVPRGGGQCTIDEVNNSKVITCTELPPAVYRLAHGAQQTAFSLMGLLAAIIILGPFARMIARRMERRAETAPSTDTLALHRELQQLQQSIDAMSVEVERISESQRFQSKLLFENKGEPIRNHIS